MPLTDSGSIATTASISPATHLYSFGQVSTPSSSPPPIAVSSIAGYISAVFEVQVRIPANTTNIGRAPGNGACRVQMFLDLGVPLTSLPTPVSNLVGLYVQ